MARSEIYTPNGNIPGVLEIWINYHPNNLRIQSVQWTNTTNLSVWAVVWDTDVDPDVPVYNDTHGPGSGVKTIPGNNKMVEVTDASGTYYDLPPNIAYQFILLTP